MLVFTVLQALVMGERVFPLLSIFFQSAATAQSHSMNSLGQSLKSLAVMLSRVTASLKGQKKRPEHSAPANEHIPAFFATASENADCTQSSFSEAMAEEMILPTVIRQLSDQCLCCCTLLITLELC